MTRSLLMKFVLFGFISGLCTALPEAYACSCIAINRPESSFEKWKIAQRRMEKSDYALVGTIIHISENLHPEASPFGCYIITVEPEKIGKGSPTNTLKLFYFVEGSPACSTDSLPYTVDDRVNILAEQRDSKTLVWQNSSCDLDSYYVFYENGPLSDNPRQLTLTDCSKRPGIPYRCRKYLP